MAPASCISLFVVDIVSLTTNGNVHAQADAHVRVLVEPWTCLGIAAAAVIAIAIDAGIAIGITIASSSSLGVIGFETLIVLVFDVAVGSLNGDVHTFADGRVGEVVSAGH